MPARRRYRDATLAGPEPLPVEQRLGMTPGPGVDLARRFERAADRADRLRPDDAALVRSFLLNLRGGWRENVRSPRSVLTYIYGIASFADQLDRLSAPGLAVATRDQVLGWVGELRGSASPKTVEVYLAGVRAFFDWLIDEGEIRPADHPVARIKAPKPPQRVNDPLTPAEIERILAACDGSLLGLRNRALFLVLLDTGLRLSEVAGISRAEVDLHFGYVTVMGKGSKERRVRLSATTLAAVDRYDRTRRREARGAALGAHLWATRTGEPMSVERIYGLHREIGDQLGIVLHPHRWRHTAAQTMLDGGMDRESVRLLLGHADLQTLRIYTSATDAGRALEQHAQHSPVEQLRRGRRRG